MDHWPTLGLLLQLLKDHQAAADEPHLITCIHHDASAEIPLLKNASERYDGQLYDLGATDDDWVAPPAPLNAHRSQVLRGVVSGIAHALPGALQLTETDGHVIAGIEGQSDAANSTSLRTVLRAAAVIASSALDGAALTLIVAGTEDADADRRELLWRLLTVPPESLNLHGKRSIVPIFSGPLDPAIDFHRRAWTDYVIRDDRVLRRTPWHEESALNTLESHTGPIVLFLGAGASASAQISLGDKYRDIALQDLLGPTVEKQDLGDKFFEYVHAMDRFIGEEREDRAKFVRTLTLERVLRETFHRLGDQPRDSTKIVRTITDECEQALQRKTRGHAALRELLRTRTRPIFVMTVNFDQLIETGLDDVVQVLSTPDDFAAAQDDIRKYADGDLSIRPPIFKLHGSIEDPSSLVASIDTTAAGLDDAVRDALNIVVGAGKGTVPWIWIGCSMRDQDINAWLNGIGSASIDEWWVDPFPGTSLDAFFTAYREAAWQRTSRPLATRLIVNSSDNFLHSLSTRLASAPTQ